MFESPENDVERIVPWQGAPELCIVVNMVQWRAFSLILW